MRFVTPHGPLTITNNNGKLKKTSEMISTSTFQGVGGTVVGGYIWSFNLPAGPACPGKGVCFLPCYARQGRFNTPGATRVREENFNTLKAMKAAGLSPEEAGFWLGTALMQLPSTANIIRWHDSGDVWSLWYARVILATVLYVRDQGQVKKYYGYSKSIPILRQISWPEGIHWVYSKGGIWDHLIQDSDPQVRILVSEEEWADGWVDGNGENGDTPALKGSPRIGLMYHGVNSLTEKQAQLLLEVG